MTMTQDSKIRQPDFSLKAINVSYIVVVLARSTSSCYSSTTNLLLIVHLVPTRTSSSAAKVENTLVARKRTARKTSYRRNTRKYKALYLDSFKYLHDSSLNSRHGGGVDGGSEERGRGAMHSGRRSAHRMRYALHPRRGCNPSPAAGPSAVFVEMGQPTKPTPHSAARGMLFVACCDVYFA
eukprot:3543599-Rhodomonas_salina.3